MGLVGSKGDEAATPNHQTKHRPEAAQAYVWSIVALAVAVLVGWTFHLGLSLYPGVLALGLGLGVACLAERISPVSFAIGKATFGFGGAPILGALVLGGPVCALLAAVPSAIYRDPRRTAFQCGIHVLQVLAGSLVFAYFCPQPLLLEGALSRADFSAQFVWGVLAAGVVFFGLDALIGPCLMRLKYGLSTREVLDEVVLPALPSDALGVAATLGAALAAVSFGTALAAPGLLLGAGLSAAALRSVRENRKRALRLASENAALKESLAADGLALASRLVAASDLRDGRGATHAAAASVYAGDIAREMGLGEARADELRLAALLMDVGLLLVPDEVLLTPQEKLNSLGRARLEEHPAKGEEILGAVPGLPPEAARWVRWHHERADGTGYPDRLRGAWIPQEARILAAASFYASLVLDGPTAPALTPSRARREVVAEIGHAMDADVAAALLRVLDTEDANYASASDDRFAFRNANRWASLAPVTTETLDDR